MRFKRQKIYGPHFNYKLSIYIAITILHPVMSLVYKVIGLVEIAVLCFAVTALAYNYLRILVRNRARSRF